MNDLLEIQIQENGDRHKDLYVKVAGFPDLILDAYYFSLAAEFNGLTPTVPDTLAALLTYWLTAIEKAADGESIYLPIDFSDQYTGCFKAHHVGSFLSLSYGFSMREGWSINPLASGDYCTTVADFQQSVGPIEFDKASLLFSIQQQIGRLKNVLLSTHRHPE